MAFPVVLKKDRQLGCVSLLQRVQWGWGYKQDWGHCPGQGKSLLLSQPNALLSCNYFSLLLDNLHLVME